MHKMTRKYSQLVIKNNWFNIILATFFPPLLFKDPVGMCKSNACILYSHTRVKLADSIHQRVNQPAVHHSDQSLKERGDKDNAPITPEAPN